MSQLLSPQQQELVVQFADGMLPFTEWIQSAGKYVPPGDNPCRAAGRLSASDLGFPAFLETLLEDSTSDRTLAARWAWIAEDPLRLSPLADVGAWRSARGLDAKPGFGAIASGNVFLSDANGRQISRADFYAPYAPLVANTMAAAQADAGASGKPIDWAKLSTDLMNDTSKFWPQDTQLKSSVFSKQFLKDLLYCDLGMRNPAPLPWRYAVLAELGENRRVGNAYGPDQVADMVEAVRDLLHQHEITPPVEEKVAYVAPVGSPPVDMADV